MSEQSRDTVANLTIGQVLELLRPEFPAISIPKIRFLEDRGLVKPERTPSGYRKFGYGEVERLRYVLRMQRDHYLPLKVIGEHLEAIDRGLQPPPLQEVTPTVPHVDLDEVGVPGAEAFKARSDARLSRQELIKIAGVDEALLGQLEDFGLIRAARGTGHYNQDHLVIAQTARELAGFGLEPRHLRGFRAAAEREAGLVEQVTSHLSTAGTISAQAAAEQSRAELAALTIRMHAMLVKSALSGG